jgi:hypothetical protein
MIGNHVDGYRCLKGSNPLLSVIYWSVGQVVKTPPFHGGNTGSNPVRIITIK